MSATVIAAGSMNATGASVDEIIARAREQIGRVAGDHAYGIKRIELRPLLLDAGEIRMWSADVEFEVFPREGERA